MTLINILTAEYLLKKRINKAQKKPHQERVGK